MVLKQKENKITNISLAKICYLLFWLLKPFYILSSGSLQIGDAFIILSFLLVIFDSNVIAKFEKIDRGLYIFFAFVFFINSIYFLILKDTSFLKSILFYAFNILGVFIGRIYLADDDFLKMFDKVLKINLWIQLIIFFVGAGRWLGTTRYMGTYNDPNQFGFAILTTYCLIYCISRKIDTKCRWVYFIITLFLIIQCSSAGMLMGISLLIISEIYFKINTINNRGTKVLYSFFLIFVTIIAVICVLYIYTLDGEIKTDSDFIQRVLAKFEKEESVFQSFVVDRNLQGFFDNPKYILYGSGEGAMLRFYKNGGELHSTWIGLLFYYGVIPFCVLIWWIRDNLKNIDKYIIPVYICVFIEALTLINHRQPSFWLLIVIASCISSKKRLHGVDNE